MAKVELYLGIILSVVMPLIKAIPVYCQVPGALLGLALLVMGIMNKRLEKKKLEMEIEQLKGGPKS